MYLKMSSTTRLLSDELKFFVMARAQEGDIYKEILEKVKKKNSKQISFGTITKILQKHGETDDIKNRWKGSRPQLFNAKETKSIVKAVKKNRLLTAVDVSANKKLNVHKASARNIQRVQRKQGLLPTTNVTQRISRKNEVKRVDFAELHLPQNSDFFEKIVFSDESDLFPQKCGRLYVRKFKAEQVCLDYASPSRHDARTIKVWSIISFSGVGPLIRYDGTIDGERYLGFLKTYLLQAYPHLKGTETRKGQLI
jgi:hypothetical protein